MDEAIYQMKLVENPKEFLINAFTEYCTLTLERVAGILGAKPLSGILRDIDKVVGYVKKYQEGSKEKNKIVNEMKIITRKLRAKYDTDGKKGGKGGIFSLFSG